MVCTRSTTTLIFPLTLAHMSVHTFTFECPKRETASATPLEHITAIAAWALLLYIVDTGIVRRVPKLNNLVSRTSIIHALSCYVVILDSLPDVLTTILEPNCAIIGGTRSYTALRISAAWHLYHPFLNMIKGDVFHHVVLAMPLFCVSFCYNNGSVTAASLCFGEGIPAAVRRTASILVELGYMETMTQKRIEFEVYTGVRAIGAIYCGILAYVTMQFSETPRWVPMLCTTSGIFNSVRYTRMYSKHYFEQRLFKKLEQQSMTRQAHAAA
jgi:hypothetical protein